MEVNKNTEETKNTERNKITEENNNFEENINAEKHKDNRSNESVEKETETADRIEVKEDEHNSEISGNLESLKGLRSSESLLSYKPDFSKRLDDDILFKVKTPSRYTGVEYNMVRKDRDAVYIRFVFAFPDVYEVGMSHLGGKILYHTINMRNDTYCERAYHPYPDLEEIMREKKIPLTTLETGSPLIESDIIGFTLQYEMSYTNIMNMLNLSGIPLRAADRGDEYPLIMAGGPCAMNPEPLTPFIDFFEIGEGEELMDDVLSVYKAHREKGFVKSEFLREIASIEGIYVPSLYEVFYNEDGTIRERKACEGAPETVKKRIIRNMEEVPYPENMLVPFCEPAHDRVVMETFRGCTRGCRFCMAGMIYRPVREKPSEKILELTDELFKNTGYEEISLTSLSTCDYSEIETLVRSLTEKYEAQRKSVSLPSIRVDAFGVELINEIQKVRKTGLTFAPEAGSQRMRDIINKNVTEEDILKAVYSAFSMGWSTIKLYTMIGLPYETLEDAAEIAVLSDKIVGEYYRVPKEDRQKGLKVNLSTSIFIPKPFTPFQWVAQERTESILKKVYEIKHTLKSRAVEYSWHESDLSRLEAVISRGDRRVAELIEKAYLNGARMDGWTEFFDLDAWGNAIRDLDFDVDFYAYREREYDEILPWDFIDVGVTKAYLKSENEKAKKGITTRDCRQGCTGCGITNAFGGEICFNGTLSD